MAHAHVALPLPPLDAKRIVATAAVIALHVAVLMLLMMPAQVARSPLAEDEVPPAIPVTLAPPPPPPPPPVQPPVRQSVTTPVEIPVAIPQTLVEPVDQNTSPVDVALPDLSETPNTYDPGPPATQFVQLATLVAPPPPYPRRALQQRLTGVVQLRIHVDAGGRPIEVTVEQGSGHAVLDEAAVRTVQSRWRFVPATRDGQAVEAWALVAIEFVLQ